MGQKARGLSYYDKSREVSGVVKEANHLFVFVQVGANRVPISREDLVRPA